jgi:uncharacterized membrane protein YagU involved in acid resistance
MVRRIVILVGVFGLVTLGAGAVWGLMVTLFVAGMMWYIPWLKGHRIVPPGYRPEFDTQENIDKRWNMDYWRSPPE